MWKIITCVLFIMLCEARIKIKIKVASSYNNAKIEYEGEDNKLITDMELQLFNFTKENLYRGMRIELGRAPDDIFWQDPTEYGDLFKKYKWPPVKRNMKVSKARIIHVGSENKVVRTTSHRNETPRQITSKISDTAFVLTSIYSTWSKTGIPNDTLNYDVEIKLDKELFKYQDVWRNATVIDVFIPFGATKNGYKSITLTPGEVAESRISGKETIVLAEVEYTAKLIGNVIGDYEDLYGKYHFYSPTVYNIMKAANMRNEIKTTQKIEIWCFTDPKFEVFDKTTGYHVQYKESTQFHHTVRSQV